MELLHNFNDGGLEIRQPQLNNLLLVNVIKDSQLLIAGFTTDQQTAINLGEKGALIIAKTNQRIEILPDDLVFIHPGVEIYFIPEVEGGHFPNALIVKNYYQGGRPGWKDPMDFMVQRSWIRAFGINSSQIADPQSQETKVLIFNASTRLQLEMKNLLQATPALLEKILNTRQQIDLLVSDELLAQYGKKRMSPREMRKNLAQLRETGGVPSGWWIHPAFNSNICVGLDNYQGISLREMEEPHIHTARPDANDSPASVEVFIPTAGNNIRSLRTMHPEKYPSMNWEFDSEYLGPAGQPIWKATFYISPGYAFIHYPPPLGEETDAIYDCATVNPAPWRSITVQSPGFSGKRQPLQKKINIKS